MEVLQIFTDSMQRHITYTEKESPPYVGRTGAMRGKKEVCYGKEGDP